MHTTKKTVNVTIRGDLRSLYFVAYNLRTNVSGHSRSRLGHAHVIGMEANMLIKLYESCRREIFHALVWNPRLRTI